MNPPLPHAQRALSPLLLVLLAASSCVGVDLARRDANLAAEQNVRPGINDNFLASDSAEQHAARFETESREIYARRHAIVEALKLRPGMAVADIGAGTGLFVAAFASAVGEQGHVYAVDIAPAMVAWIGQRIRREGLGNVHPVQCTDRSSGLAEASIDLAFVCDTYHHFEFPQNTLASIHRALRPGGQLVVIDFHRIPGKSRQWTLDHVRAGEEVFRQEILDAGFELVERRDDLLEENWFARFARVER